MRPLVLLLLLAAPALAADPPKKRAVDLDARQLGVLGLTLPEADKPVRSLRLTADADGRGSLVLDCSDPPAYDELGFVAKYAPAREVKLDCTLKYVKTVTKTFQVRVGGPSSDKYKEEKEDWSLFSVTGPKVTSRLSLALPPESPWPRGRLLVHDKDGTVKHAIDLVLPPQPEPCHPGCFPAGTPVRVPGCTAAVETLRVGDAVTVVGADGKPAAGKVTGVFVTRNRLLEVKTADGTLRTTATQPVALEAGGYRPAGELKAGDRVWRWDGSARRAAAVVSVSAGTAAEAEVFNLVLGDPTGFVAGGFVVRSKPPAEPRP